MVNRSSRLTTYTANAVRHRREMLELSQEELAELCGMHRTYVGSIERGERNITLSTLLKLSEALNCEIFELIPRREELDIKK